VLQAPSCDCCKCGESPKEYETVQVLTETAEEQRGTKTVTSRVPKIVDRETTIEVPEEYTVDEEYQEPYLVKVTKSRQVPEIVYKEVPEVRTRAVQKNVPFEQVEEYTVNETVPYSEPVTTQVQVPFTKVADVEVIEKLATQ